MIGQNFLEAPLFQKILSKTSQGTLRLTRPVDGKDRLGSARLLNDFPIAVIATTTVSAALADWRGKNRFFLAPAGLSPFVIKSMPFFVLRQISPHTPFSPPPLSPGNNRPGNPV